MTKSLLDWQDGTEIVRVREVSGNPLCLSSLVILTQTTMALFSTPPLCGESTPDLIPRLDHLDFIVKYSINARSALRMKHTCKYQIPVTRRERTTG